MVVSSIFIVEDQTYITVNSFVILRYSGIIATFPSLFFTSVQSQHCQVAVVVSQVGVVLVVASSGIIFCYRIFAIWNGVRAVQFGVTFMFLVMMSCWVNGILLVIWFYWLTDSIFRYPLLLSTKLLLVHPLHSGRTAKFYRLFRGHQSATGHLLPLTLSYWLLPF